MAWLTLDIGNDPMDVEGKANLALFLIFLLKVEKVGFV